MTRIVLLIVAVLVFFWLLRRALAGRRKGGVKAPPPPAQAPELVACARCGVHLPKGEAVAAQDEAGAEMRFYCGPEHRRLGPK